MMFARSLAAVFIGAALAACAPAPPQPEAQSDHYFESRGARLHGRLYTPEGRGPFPTVLYVTGGGDYSLLTDAYAQNTVRAFLDRGVAVYVFDKRGLGQSGGNFESSNLAGKQADVEAALDLMRTLPQVDQNCMIVWAISGAGWFAPQAIEGREDVCAMILVSPAGVNPIDWLAMLMRRELTRAGVTGQAQAEAEALWRALMRYDGTAENYEETRARLAEAQRRPWHRAAIAGEMWEGLPQSADALLAPDALRGAWEAAPDDYAWQRERAHYEDFTGVYRSVRQPVLLIFGSIDTLIDPVESRAIFERVWAGRADVEIATFEGAGHGIQARGDPENPMPAYLDRITAWAAARFAE